MDQLAWRSIQRETASAANTIVRWASMESRWWWQAGRAWEWRPRVARELDQDELTGHWTLAAGELALAAGSANRSTELPSGSWILA
jgi:hypothetical protein